MLVKLIMVTFKPSGVETVVLLIMVMAVISVPLVVDFAFIVELDSCLLAIQIIN